MKEEELVQQMESDAYIDSDKSGGSSEDESELESEDEDGSGKKTKKLYVD